MAFIVSENSFKQKIFLDPQDVIGRTILEKGIYDKTGLFFIEAILSRMHKPLVFDVGASIGNHALRMSQYSQMVYLFEPQAQLAHYLHQTKTENSLDNWKIFNFGLSNENQILPLYRNLESNIETSFVSELKSQHFVKEEATVRIGDQVVRENALARLDFLKIDVEGFEAQVIQGLAHSIRTFRPVIFMEWDKDITKQAFHQKNIFLELFHDYAIKALRRNPVENGLCKKLRARIARFFSRDKTRKRWIISDFDPNESYRHILLIPQEKLSLTTNLHC